MDEKLAGVAGTAGPSTRSTHSVQDEEAGSRGRPCHHPQDPPPALPDSRPMVPPALRPPPTRQPHLVPGDQNLALLLDILKLNLNFMFSKFLQCGRLFSFHLEKTITLKMLSDDYYFYLYSIRLHKLVFGAKAQIYHAIPAWPLYSKIMKT